MSGSPQLFDAPHTMVREEIASVLGRLAGHALAAFSHAQAGADRALAMEVRCASAALLTAADLIQELRPSHQTGRAGR